MMVCGYTDGGHGYCGVSNYRRARSFLTKDVKIEILKEYQRDLEKEIQGVSERLKGLEKNN